MMPAADDVTDDAFLGGRLAILQPSRGYRAGVDAVLLAAACQADAGVRVLDAGAGVGVVGLCVARRCPTASVTLLEREPVYAHLARENVARNGLLARVTVVEADVTDPAGLSGEFAHVLANPPYQATGQGRRPPDDLKAAAHEMPAGALDAWARAFARLAAPGGTVTVIHRAEALADLLSVLDGRFGELLVRPIHPRAEAPAVRVLVRGVKGSRGRLSIAPPLVLHDRDGAFLPDVAAVLREGAPL